MVLIGVLTNCNSGDLLAIASIMDMALEHDRIHIRIYAQNGNTKYGVIKVLYRIIKEDREKQGKKTAPIEISRYRCLSEYRYANHCLSAQILEEAEKTRFVNLPNTGFDKLYAFSEIEELLDVNFNGSKLKGDELYIYGDYKNLKGRYLSSSNVVFSHNLAESRIKYLFAKFKTIYYFTDRMVLGETMTSKLYQGGNKSLPVQEWWERIQEGNELFEFLCMVTKNDNLTLASYNIHTYKNISTSIDIMPFACVFLPNFTFLFTDGRFCSLNKNTLEPIFVEDEQSVEGWKILYNHTLKRKILYDCLCAYFKR